jgi:hypothetical protein
VIATLGRYEELLASGQLERLLQSGARFTGKAMVLTAVADDAVATIASRRIGPALVFERLWEETGCRAAINELAGPLRVPPQASRSARPGSRCRRPYASSPPTDHADPGNVVPSRSCGDNCHPRSMA